MSARIILSSAAMATSLLVPQASAQQQPAAQQPGDAAPAGAAAPPTLLPPVVVTQPQAPSPGAAPEPKQKALKPKSTARVEPSPPTPAAKKPAPATDAAIPAAPVQAATPAAEPAPQPPTPSTGTLVDGLEFAPAQTVGPETIAVAGGATITDALQTQPGLAGSTFAPGANRPIVRGLDNTRVRVQEDGTTTGDVSDLSEDHAVPVSPCAVTATRLVRGPAALRFSSKAAAGVVEVETGRIPDAVPANGVTGEVRGGVSSGDDGSDGCFRTTAGSSGFAVHAEGFAQHKGDYRIPGGIQPNTFVDADGFSFGGSFAGPDGFIGVSYTRFASLYGIPGTEAAEARKRIDLGQDKIGVKGEWRIRDYGLDAIRASFGYADYAHDEIVFDAEAGADAVGSRFLNREYEGRFEIDHARIALPFGGLRGTAGIQVSDRTLSGTSFEGDNLLEPGTTRKTAGFLVEELQLTPHLRLVGGIRIEHAAVTGATFADLAAPAAPLVSYDNAYLTLGGSAGLLYELPIGVTARLSALHAERAPEAPELFSKGAHEATGTFELGNPGLGVETARTIEAGLTRTTGALRFDAAAFYTKYQGFIFRRLTGETCEATVDSCSPAGAGGDLKQVIFGQRDATFHGVELAGEYDVAPLWRGVWGVAGRYDFVRATFDDGENVPRIPPHRLGGGLFYRDGAWRARIDLLHAFGQDDTAAQETPTSGYTLLGAEASYTLKLASDGRLGPELTIGVKGDNLLDDDVRNAASYKKDEVLQPGRNVRLFGIVRF